MFTILYKLFGPVLYFCYTLTNSYGWAIVVFAILSKLILIPFTIKQTKSMQMMQALDPEIKEVQAKYANNKQKQGEEMMKIYNKYNFNPLSSCLPLLLQMPFLFGLFGVLRMPETYVFTKTAMANIPMNFLWINNLTLSATDVMKASGYNMDLALYCIIPILVVLFTYLQQKQTPQTQPGTQGMMNIMMLVMMGYFTTMFSQALGIYWLLQTALGVLQTWAMNKFMPAKPVASVVSPKKKGAK